MITREQVDDIFKYELKDIEYGDHDTYVLAAATLGSGLGLIAQIPKYGPGGRVSVGQRVLVDDVEGGVVTVESMWFKVEVVGMGQDLLDHLSHLINALAHIDGPVPVLDGRKAAAS